MESQKKTEASSVPRKIVIPNQYKWDIYSFAIPIICIILFPSGLIFYLSGRMNIHLAGIYFLSLFGILGTFLILFFVNIVRMFMKNTLKKRLLILFEIFMPLLFVLSFYFFHIIGDSKDPFLCGYRDQILGKIDIDEAQAWLKTVIDENYISDIDRGHRFKKQISYDDYPKLLKASVYGKGIRFHIDEFGNPVLDFNIGGGFFHWGFVIGAKDMVYSESQINEKRKHDEELLLVQPGFYVYAQF